MAKSRPSLRRKALIVVALNIPIALLHLVTGSDYEGPFPLFVNGYMMDILIPFGSYFLLCLFDHPILDSWLVRASTIFLAAYAVEMAQFKGLPLFGHTFDSWDFLMYGLGVLLAVVCDQVLFPRLFSFWKTSRRTDWSSNQTEEETFIWRKN